MAMFSENVMLKAWVVFFVLATVSGLVAGAVAGGAAGVIVVMVTGSKDSIPLYAGIAGFAASLPFSYLSFRFAVQKFLAGYVVGTD